MVPIAHPVGNRGRRAYIAGAGHHGMIFVTRPFTETHIAAITGLHIYALHGLACIEW
jgi:hypothetical protein